MRMAPAYTGAIFMKAIKRRRFAIVHGLDSNKFLINLIDVIRFIEIYE